MSYKEKMQTIWGQYEQANGDNELTIKGCFDWAFANGLWSPRPVDVS